MDGGHRWKTAESAAEANQPFPHRCQFVALNFGVEDITEEMGATEVWIGSHIEPSTVTHNRGLDPAKGTEQLEGLYRTEVAARREIAPPVRMEIPKGWAALRDNRVWHRGVHNRTDNPRHMAGFAYLAAPPDGGQGQPPSGEMVFGPGCEELVAGSLLLPQVPCAEAGSETEVIQGHGDWSGPLPTLEEIERKFSERPWANRGGWASRLAMRVLSRAAASEADASSSKL
jgi:hypothetical protein